MISSLNVFLSFWEFILLLLLHKIFCWITFIRTVISHYFFERSTEKMIINVTSYVTWFCPSCAKAWLASRYWNDASSHVRIHEKKKIGFTKHIRICCEQVWWVRREANARRGMRMRNARNSQSTLLTLFVGAPRYTYIRSTNAPLLFHGCT